MVDPIIAPGIPSSPSYAENVKGAVARRSVWSSRSEALAAFEKNPYFAAWDPRVLRSHVKDGLVEREDGTVTLKTSGFQEAVTFAELTLVFETWELIERLDDRVRIHWMMAGIPPLKTGSEENTAQTVWRRSHNTTNVRIRGAGHLIPQEAPESLAFGINQFLRDHLAIANDSHPTRALL